MNCDNCGELIVLPPGEIIAVEGEPLTIFGLSLVMAAYGAIAFGLGLLLGIALA